MHYYSISKEMVACYASPRDKWNLADLWQETFRDPPEYVDLFFRRVYKPDNALIIRHKGFIVSALHIVPYKLKFYNKIEPVAYICGACTHPFERGKGLMKALIDFTKKELIRRGFVCAIVIPAENRLFDFYRKLGFEHAIYHRVFYKFQNDSYINQPENGNKYTFVECTVKYFNYFDSMLRNRDITILHDIYDFETILQELRCCEGNSFVALENDIPVGLVFIEKLPHKAILVKELVAESREVEKALYGYIFKRYDVDYLKIHASHLNYCTPTEQGLYCDFQQRFKFTYPLKISLMHD